MRISDWSSDVCSSDLWQAGRAAAIERAADTDRAPRIFAAHHRDARSGARTCACRRNAMTRLKLAALADAKPVRLTLELSARLHRALVAYALAVNEIGRASCRARVGQYV